MNQDILDKINDVINKQKEDDFDDETNDDKIKQLQNQISNLKKNSSCDLKKQLDNLKISELQNLENKTIDYQISKELLLISKYAIIAGLIFFFINCNYTLNLFDNYIPSIGRCNGGLYPLFLRCLLFMVLFTLTSNILFKFIEPK